MDFVEQLFGVSPDHGDGTTELLYVFVFLLVVVAVGSRREIAKIFRILNNPGGR